VPRRIRDVLSCRARTIQWRSDDIDQFSLDISNNGAIDVLIVSVDLTSSPAAGRKRSGCGETVELKPVGSGDLFGLSFFP